jgi:hypothetical protein
VLIATNALRNDMQWVVSVRLRSHPQKGDLGMPKYRVTVRVSSVEIVEADNPYMAAVAAAGRHDDEVEIADVRPAVGRPVVNGNSASRKATKKSAKTLKTAAKKRRRLSPEARAKLAQNLVKARAARAAKRKGTVKRSSTNRGAKKAGRATKKRTSKRP